MFAGHDPWHYWQAVSAGYTELAASGHSLWQLACGVGEAVATVVLGIVSVRLLGTKFDRSVVAS